MSNPQGKSEGSTGVQTPRRLVGPERASIRMLDGSSRHFDRSSAEACEGGSPLCSGAAAGCPKFGLAEKVSQRLNEMSSISARPPTPIGSSEDAGAAMAHLAPTRRAHSRFASPSKADSLPSRMTSKSGSFAVPDSSSLYQKGDLPEDLDAPGPRFASMRFHHSGSGSPAQAAHLVSFSDDPHVYAALKQGTEKSTFPHFSSPSSSPSQRSAPLPTLPRLQNQDTSMGAAAWPTSLSGTAASVTDSPKPRRRASNLGPLSEDRSSSLSQLGPLQLLQSGISPPASQAQVAPDEHISLVNLALRSPTSILDDTDVNVCDSTPKSGSLTQNSRHSGMAGRQIPTIPDVNAALRSNQHSEAVRQPAIDGKYPSFSALGLQNRGDSGKEAGDTLSSWMQNR
mmetsp:Transcript_16415/g.44981  ORF Transcript_16415/g.44981 Transcript_16415/m.44981 type:complete len:397 (-) Transcript_16415:115-1305(-)